MDCSLCSRSIEKHLLCSSCINQVVKDKKDKIKLLEQKIQNNNEIFLKVSENLKETHKESIKKLKREYNEAKIKVEIEEATKRNDEIKKKIQNLTNDLEVKKQKLQEHRFILEKRSELIKPTSFSLSSSYSLVVDKKKKNIEMLKTQMPITLFNDGYSINICESITLPLDISKFLSQSLEVINGTISLFTTYLIILCDYLSINLPFTLSVHTNPMIEYLNEKISLYYDENKKKEFLKGISYFNLNVNFICSQVGVFVTKFNSDNFIKNIFLLSIYPRLHEVDPVIMNETTKKRLEADGNNFYFENGLIVNLVPLGSTDKKPVLKFMDNYF